MPISNSSMPSVPDGLHAEDLTLDGTALLITARTTAAQASSRVCGRASTRVHSTYWRRFEDLPWLVTSTCAVSIVIEAGAEIRLTGPLPLMDAVDTIRGVIRFTGNAHGSTLTGTGTVNGNRSDPAMLAAYLAGPRSVQSNGLYVMKTLWDCVAFGGVNDVTIEGVTLKGCMTDALQRSFRACRRLNRLAGLAFSSL